MQINQPGRRTSNKKLIAGIVISALAHVLVFGLLFLWAPDHQPVAPRETVRLNVVDRVPRSELENAPLVGVGPEPRQSADQLDGQIVTLPEPAVQQKPDSARFLSQYDVRVDHEQVSRNRAAAGAAPGTPSQAPGRRSRPSASDSDPGESADDQPAQAVAADAAADQAAERSPGAVTLAPKTPGRFASLRGFENLLLPSSAAGGRGGGLNMRALSNEMLSDDSMAYGAGFGGAGSGGGGGTGGGGSDDVFMGVEDEGDVNLVNSRSFRFWAFFDRVKSQVRAEWDPATVYRSRDPSGKVFGSRDRYTILAVVLGSDGAIRQLEVVHPSGLDFLDEEASRAFLAAGPFPNPPSGLIDDRGLIVFRFGFLLEFGSSTGSFFWQRAD